MTLYNNYTIITYKQKGDKMKTLTKEEFYKKQNKRIDDRTDNQKKQDSDSIHKILRKLQGK